MEPTLVEASSQLMLTIPAHSSNNSCRDREKESKETATGRWTQEEHQLFLEGLKLYKKQWKLIADLIKTRTVVQIRTHAQKYFQKLVKANKGSEYDELFLQEFKLKPTAAATEESDAEKKPKLRQRSESELINSMPKAKKTKQELGAFTAEFDFDRLTNFSCGEAFFFDSAPQLPLDEMDLFMFPEAPMGLPLSQSALDRHCQEQEFFAFRPREDSLVTMESSSDGDDWSRFSDSHGKFFGRSLATSAACADDDLLSFLENAF